MLQPNIKQAISEHAQELHAVDFSQQFLTFSLPLIFSSPRKLRRGKISSAMNGNKNTRQLTLLKTSKLERLMCEAATIIGKNARGRLPKAAYNFIRKHEPLLSVDAVMVPEGSKPSVLLLKRQKGVVAAGEYYSVGGRLGMNKSVAGTMRRIVKAETGLNVSVRKENIIGFGTVWYKPSKKEGHDYDVFTPCLSFAVRVPPAGKLRRKLKIGHGNIGWKVFTKIDKSWDNYVAQAVARAWDIFYGKGWRKGKAVSGRKKGLAGFIPLEYAGKKSKQLIL